VRFITGPALRVLPRRGGGFSIVVYAVAILAWYAAAAVLTLLRGLFKRR